jgi:glycosyltransferase involved in cell wall biosynthesis
MKVLMISVAFVVGAYHGKLRELARCGVDLTAVVPSRRGKQKREQVEPSGYKLLVMDCKFSGANHFHFYPDIARIIGREEWDLVHIDEEPFNLVTYHTLKACERSRRRAIFFTWQNIYKYYPPPFNYFERFSFQHAQAAIAGNDEARGILQAREFSKPIAVIPQFGVDPEFFRKRDVPELRRKFKLEDKFAIGYVGRIVKEKGIADLIQAMASLPERCILVLVGSGGFEPQARQLAETLGVASRIRWVPHISSLEVADYMNVFDVLALPSRTTLRWKEQFGRVLVEAMACERPVVGSNSGEIPNVIGEGGLVFPEGDVATLTGQLRRLHDDPRLALDLSARGRARVLENFTHRRIAEQTVELYRHVLTDSSLTGLGPEGRFASAQI